MTSIAGLHTFKKELKHRHSSDYKKLHVQSEGVNLDQDNEIVHTTKKKKRKLSVGSSRLYSEEVIVKSKERRMQLPVTDLSHSCINPDLKNELLPEFKSSKVIHKKNTVKHKQEPQTADASTSSLRENRKKQKENKCEEIQKKKHSKLKEQKDSIEREALDIKSSKVEDNSIQDSGTTYVTKKKKQKRSEDSSKPLEYLKTELSPKFNTSTSIQDNSNLKKKKNKQKYTKDSSEPLECEEDLKMRLSPEFNRLISNKDNVTTYVKKKKRKISNGTNSPPEFEDLQTELSQEFNSLISNEVNGTTYLKKKKRKHGEGERQQFNEDRKDKNKTKEDSLTTVVPIQKKKHKKLKKHRDNLALDSKNDEMQPNSPISNKNNDITHVKKKKRKHQDTKLPDSTLKQVKVAKEIGDEEFSKLPKVKEDSAGQESDSSVSSFEEYFRKNQEIIKIDGKIDLEQCASNYDYLLSALDVESQRQRLKDEYKEMLKYLVVQSPWPIPESHLIETRMSSHPSKEQQQKFQQLGLDMKTSHYDANEDQTIRDNWLYFCKVHNLRNDPQPFLSFQTMKDTKMEGNALPKHERINFVRFLGHNLPHRYLFSIHRRFKNLYMDKIKRGKFTKVEDDIIVNFMKNSTTINNYSKLALILNRDRHGILLRHRILSEKHYR